MPTPLEVLLRVMNRKWTEGDEDGAVQLAKAAAPYVHPRAAARGSVDLAEVGDDELERMHGGDGAGAAEGPPD